MASKGDIHLEEASGQEARPQPGTSRGVKPSDQLLLNRLVAFGVPSAEAARIVSERRVRHQWGPRKSDVEYLSLRLFTSPGWSSYMTGLRLAEHIARVFHNWDHCYAVNTTELAMMARA